jgi:hypothetical protein
MSGSHDDPRPVFDGDWAKATGTQRQAHMTLVAAWKARNGVQGATPRRQGQSAKAGAAQGQAQSQDEERTAHLSTLQQVIDAPGALASDRIRAVEARERILSKQAEEQALEAHGPLVALGDALRALPEGERVEALSTLLDVQ